MARPGAKGAAALIGAVMGGLVGARLMREASRETYRLHTRRCTLTLPNLPEEADGIRIAFLTDLHCRHDLDALALCHEACIKAVDEEPSLILFGGDYVGRGLPDQQEVLQVVLEPIRSGGIPAYGVFGNHDYYGTDPENLAPILRDCGIRTLRNEWVKHEGLVIAGVDSAHRHRHDLRQALPEGDGALVVWHEPDMADALPRGCALMLAGHTHGGQFLTPWGWGPLATDFGAKYVSGFFPEPPSPLYVSRGLGAAGPPIRLFCPPELSILTLKRGIAPPCCAVEGYEEIQQVASL